MAGENIGYLRELPPGALCHLSGHFSRASLSARIRGYRSLLELPSRTHHPSCFGSALLGSCRQSDVDLRSMSQWRQRELCHLPSSRQSARPEILSCALLCCSVYESAAAWCSGIFRPAHDFVVYTLGI